MSLRPGSAELAPIYQSCVFRSDARVDSHLHVARELADHRLVWKRGAIDTALFKGALRHLQMFVLRYGAEVEVKPEPFEDFALVHMSLRGGAEIEADGRRVDVAEGRAAFIAPRSSVRLRWYGGTEQLILKIPHALLLEVGSQYLDEKVEFAPACLIPRALASQWDLLVASLLNLMRLPDGSAVNATWLDHIERNVVLFLLAHQANPTQQAVADNRWADQRDAVEVAGEGSDAKRIDAMLQYMRSRLYAPIGLEDLAAAAGVSIRTLNALCHRHLGETPMGLLRDMRLDAVRAELLADPKAGVTQTALEFGFGHLGRFAAYYAERFGELPSNTVAQHAE